MTSGTIGDKKVFFFDTFLRWCRRQVRQSSGLLKESKEFLRVAVVDWQFSFCFANCDQPSQLCGGGTTNYEYWDSVPLPQTYGWLVLLMLQSLSPRR